jgi:diguanylate cyclase (GGDEF)-like protein
MNGAVFFLGVNFSVAACFAAAFAVVSTRSRSRSAAQWFAAGFAVASLSAISELLVAYTGATKFWAVLAFATVFGGLVLLRVGVGCLYGQKLHPLLGAGSVLAAIGLDLAIYDLPRSSVAHAFAYQAPFGIAVLSSALVVFLSKRRTLIDRVLGLLLTLTGLHFFAKAGLAVLVGAGSTAKDYLGSDYALISQSSTGVLSVAIGLTLLSVLVLDMVQDERSKSERDILSGLPNRRGFENGVQAVLARSRDGGHAIIICDLDHFKSINDTYGHHVGDVVIRRFGELLKDSAPANAVIGRVGGEEFIVFLPHTTGELAFLFAQALRSGLTGMALDEVASSFSVTASFGVAELVDGGDLAEAMYQADMALYDAKRAGRNRVIQARELSKPTVVASRSAR